MDPKKLPGVLEELGFTNRKLREHQIDGVTWLCRCFAAQNGSILADEMGLGKTTQSLAFLCLKNSSSRTSLVVAPLSVLGGWESELKSFLPGLSVVKYYGDAETRVSLQHQKCEIMITTYEVLLKDHSFFESRNWNLVIIDEGHRLKNSMSQTNQKLREVKCSFRLILSGTPVQNNLNELYSLLSFVDCEAFPLEDLSDFCDRYEKGMHDDELHELLRPYLLRRTKTQVLSKLPPSQESIVFCKLSLLQKDVYKGILTKDSSVIDMSSNKSVLQNVLMQLRKCSNHPYMFNGIEPEPFCIGEHLVEASGKLRILDKILSYCQSHQHRVLIFSQFTLTLDILQDYAQYRRFSYERLDGSVRDQERFNSINNFTDNEIFCFLLSTRAGGVGLNLTAADTVIFYDTDWNPQNDLQAAARAHRIGQTKPVKIIRLVSKNTVDEYMLKRMESKLKLTKRVIAEGGFSSLDTAMEDTKTLSDMLLFGFSDLLSNGSENDLDESVDSILGETDEKGCWVFAANEDHPENNGQMGNDVKDYYDFEGQNYRDKKVVDRKAFDDAAKANLEAKKQSSGNISNLLRNRKSVNMSEEEIIKKAEILDLEYKAAQDLRKAKRIQKKKEEWDEIGYISSSLPSSILSDNLFSTMGLEYVVGDVTKPDKTGLILHCTDSSGDWGSGGLFTAITRQSTKPKEAYELAKDMGDLRLGQCHIVEYHPGLLVALLVCIRRGNSSIKFDLKSLGEALASLSKYAKENNQIVHMPRVGFSTEDWYGAERLLRKCLLSQDIPTYVYYFSRASNSCQRISNIQPSQCRPSSGATAVSSPLSKKFKSSNHSSGPDKAVKEDGLPNKFCNKVIFLDPALNLTEKNVLERYLIAANGDVQLFMDENVDYVVSYDTDFEVGPDHRPTIFSPYKLKSLLND